MVDQGESELGSQVLNIARLLSLVQYYFLMTIVKEKFNWVFLLNA